MSTSDLHDSRPDLIPLPAGAVVLIGVGPELDSPRQLALVGLRQSLQERQLQTLPLGPTIDPEDPDRLLSLNGIAVQLACCGLISDEIQVDLSFWRRAETAPQLLLAAAVDEENQVVYFPGVLTGREVVDLAQGASVDAAALRLAVDRFRGGFERLLTLALLMEPQALPRLALPKAAVVSIGCDVVNVLDWLQGTLAEALAGLGGFLQPVPAAAFRSATLAIPEQDQALAILSIPLAISNGALVCGVAARDAIERLQLLVIPCGSGIASTLLLRIVGDTPGTLLPDRLTLSALQGDHEQSITSNDSTSLDLRCPASPLAVIMRLTLADQQPLAPLPPFLLLPDQPLP